uniref:WD repeat domain 33 n=1 Tax=Fundulus heteroclitus TaxID=8078 RepID=A0A3Q2QVK4_FUNHE
RYRGPADGTRLKVLTGSDGSEPEKAPRLTLLLFLCSFSPTDNKFATCSDDGTVRIWDFLRCHEERILRGHGADVKCVDWHPTKGLVVSGSKDSQQPIKFWDPKTGQSLATLHAHKNTVMEVKWNLNGNWLLTASRDHLCKLFDIRNLKEELQVFRGHKKEATAVAWHPVHEGLFASGGSDGSLLFWHVGVEKEVGGMEMAHEGMIWSLAWHPLGHILCSGSNDHTSKFWTRNRPGDKMRDRYNLNLLPGMSEDGMEYDDVEPNSLATIPGMGIPEQLKAAMEQEQSSKFWSRPVEMSIPGLDWGVDEVMGKDSKKVPQKKVPYAKPIPAQFQQAWAENKVPILPPSAALSKDRSMEQKVEGKKKTQAELEQEMAALQYTNPQLLEQMKMNQMNSDGNMGPPQGPGSMPPFPGPGGPGSSGPPGQQGYAPNMPPQQLPNNMLPPMGPGGMQQSFMQPGQMGPPSGPPSHQGPPQGMMGPSDMQEPQRHPGPPRHMGPQGPHGMGPRGMQGPPGGMMGHPPRGMGLRDPQGPPPQGGMMPPQGNMMGPQGQMQGGMMGPPPRTHGNMPNNYGMGNMQGPQGGMQGPQGGMQGPQGGMQGPHGGMQGPHGGMQGPQGGMQGPQGGMQGPQGGMQGPQGGMQGPQGGMQGPQGGMQGPQGGMQGPHGNMQGPPYMQPQVSLHGGRPWCKPRRCLLLSPGHDGYRDDGSSPGGRERPSSMQGMDMASLPPRKRPWQDGPGTGDHEAPDGGELPAPLVSHAESFCSISGEQRPQEERPLQAGAQRGQRGAAQPQRRVQGAGQGAQVHRGPRGHQPAGPPQDRRRRHGEQGAQGPEQRELPGVEQQQRGVQNREAEAERRQRHAHPEAQQPLLPRHAGQPRVRFRRPWPGRPAAPRRALTGPRTGPSAEPAARYRLRFSHVHRGAGAGLGSAALGLGQVLLKLPVQFRHHALVPDFLSAGGGSAGGAAPRGPQAEPQLQASRTTEL